MSQSYWAVITALTASAERLPQASTDSSGRWQVRSLELPLPWRENFGACLKFYSFCSLLRRSPCSRRYAQASGSLL
jgi:hypothetical protein